MKPDGKALEIIWKDQALCGDPLQINRMLSVGSQKHHASFLMSHAADCQAHMRSVLRWLLKSLRSSLG